MGEVYRARDSRLPRDVAIKVLPAPFSTDVERLQRFEQEARAAASLSHPNILAVHDIGRHDGAPFIVYELLEGATLREHVSAGAMSVRKVIDYGAQISRGLAAAHGKGIVHRDLKPENLFVTADGHLKILDFGLAKLTQSETVFAATSDLPTTPPNTNPGVVLGTAGYMSPEQVRGVTADARADIFALGTILYEMLSGRRPFHGETAMDAMTAIVKDHPPDLPAHIPPALVRIVERCLEKNPSARFQTATDLAFAIEELSQPSGIAESPGPAAPVSRGRLRWVVAAALLGIVSIVGIAVAAFVLASRPTGESPVYRVSIIPPGELAVNARSRMAISPDGRRVAFAVRTADGGSMIWVRSLDALTAQPLAGTEFANSPFWSADSGWIGFLAQGKLKAVSASGGPVTTLADAAFGGGGSWNADNVILYTPSQGSPLFKVPATGGTPVQVTTLDAKAGENLHALPHFLPDGRHFLYAAAKLGPTRYGIYIGSLDAPGTTAVIEGVSQAVYAQGHLVYLRGTTLMAQPFDVERRAIAGDAVPLAEQVQMDPQSAAGAFTASSAGVVLYQTGTSSTRLTWFDRAGRQLGTMGERGDYDNVFLSPDGTRASVSVGETGAASRDDWVFDVARGLRTRFTFHSADEREAVWSPDGTRLVFNSSRNGSLDLYVKAANGSGSEEVLLADTLDKFPQSWSPDGRFIIYIAQMRNTVGITQDLWVLPLFGDRKPFPFVQTSFNERMAQFSPDGRWVAYASLESGRTEVYVAPFPGTGAKWQVSAAGGSSPRWRRDGAELFYEGADRKVMAASVSTKGDTFEVRGVQPLFGTRRGGNFWWYDVTPDGQRFLVNNTEESAALAPITLLVNWPASLNR